MCTKVFAFLRDAIIHEKIKPGEKLNVALIASKLGVSRSPVREAIRILEAHNFVETIPQRGAFVKQITTEEVEDLYVVLKALLCEAAQLTTKYLEAQSHRELMTIVRELKQAKEGGTVADTVDAFRNFHNFIVNKCRNQLLIKLHDSLFVYRERPFLLTDNFEQADLHAATAENVAICHAVLKGDEQSAERLMRNHMDNARLRTLKALSKKNSS